MRWMAGGVKEERRQVGSARKGLTVQVGQRRELSQNTITIIIRMLIDIEVPFEPSEARSLNGRAS